MLCGAKPGGARERLDGESPTWHHPCIIPCHANLFTHPINPVGTITLKALASALPAVPSTPGRAQAHPS
eukprot:5509109-Amphidinium_carterae.1